jgi:hypothetical protein
MQLTLLFMDATSLQVLESLGPLELAPPQLVSYVSAPFENCRASSHVASPSKQGRAAGGQRTGRSGLSVDIPNILMFKPIAQGHAISSSPAADTVNIEASVAVANATKAHTALQSVAGTTKLVAGSLQNSRLFRGEAGGPANGDDKDEDVYKLDNDGDY